MSAEIHKTAIVDPGAKLGAGVIVGPYAIVGPEVTIGARSEIGTLGNDELPVEEGHQPQDAGGSNDDPRPVHGNAQAATNMPIINQGQARLLTISCAAGPP